MRLNRKPSRPQLQPDYAIERPDIVSGYRRFAWWVWLLSTLLLGFLGASWWRGPLWQLAVLLVVAGVGSGSNYMVGLLARRPG